jgi:hypothetical protein
MEIKVNPRKIILFLAAAIVSLLAVSTALQVYKFRSLGGNSRYLIDLLDLDKEFNIPTLFQTLHLFIAAAVVFGIGHLEKAADRRRAWYWKVISIAVAVAACDELLEFHEKILSPLQQALHTGGFLQNAWVIPGALFVLVFGVYLLRFLKSLPKTTLRFFILAAAIYLTGALGIEMIGAKLWTIKGSGNLLYAIVAGIEESFEMFGLLVFDIGLLGYLRTTAPAIDVKIVWSGNPIR